MTHNTVLWMIQAFLLLLQINKFVDAGNNNVNSRPIIGVPVMAITDKLLLKKKPRLKGKSYIAASYVKYLEMAGARVVPIKGNIDEDELIKIFNSVNGLLFTGGEVNLESSTYYHTTKKLFKLATTENSGNGYFPVLGICRGMQAMLVHAVGNLSILKLTDSTNYTTSLKWISTSGKLLKDIPDKLIEATSRNNVTAHFHKYGITPEDFRGNSKVNDVFKIVATSVDRHGKEFVSIYEGKQGPYYGLQFHPEKTIFEWAETVSIPHTSETIRFSQQLADNFMDQVRKNKHRFESIEEERKYTISRKEPLYTGFLPNSHSPFVQIYVF